jgi:hypothetical protein
MDRIMPPRYAYWTILVDEQPTAFRSSSQEELQPTFKRLKEKHASARMVWFQNGKVWNSRLDAQEAMRARGEMGRKGDTRQGGGFRDRDRDRDPREQRDPAGKLEWKPRDSSAPKSKGAGAARPRAAQTSRPRPEWNPKDTRRSSPAHVRGAFSKPKKLADKGSDKLEWKPRTETSRPKSQGHGARARQGGDQRRDKTWRPGGEHRDPRQKYKDAKKAKWTRFKQNIRKRWESKQGNGKKRRDDE